MMKTAIVAQYRNIADPSSVTALPPDMPPSLEYPDNYNTFVPYLLALETKKEVFDNGGNIRQLTENSYFCPAGAEYPGMGYLKSEVYQYNHPGNWAENSAFWLIDNYYPYKGSSFDDFLLHLVKLMLGNSINHPFKYIDRSYYVSNRYITSPVVYMDSSKTYNYFEDGSQSNSTTEYLYDFASPSIPARASTVYSDGNTSMIHNVFANMSNAQHPELDEFDGAALNFLNGFKYALPLISKLSINGTAVENNFTALGLDNNKIVPVSNWRILGGGHSLTGLFSDYNIDGKTAEVHTC